jgi:dephospho-CoA kinase
LKKFTDFIIEKLITIGGGRPKYDNVVIMAGGAGSGKGFVIKNLLGIQGKVFDVDKFKNASLKYPLLRKKIKEEFGDEFTEKDLNDPKKVSRLHKIIKTLELQDSSIENLLMASLWSKNKPNIIFDTVMSSLHRLNELVESVREVGYKKENIHIVWVVADLDTALQQNKNRSRRVDDDILADTHKHVALTFKNIFKNSDSFRKRADGDIWLVFNKKYVDTLITSSGFGGKFLEKALYVQVKKQGEPIMSGKDVSWRFVKKLRNYTKTKVL